MPFENRCKLFIVTSEDPNTSKQGDQFALSYMDRLRKLQQQYGVKKPEETTGTSATSDQPQLSSGADSLSDLRARLRGIHISQPSSTPAITAPTIPVPAPVPMPVQDAPAPVVPPSSTAASLNNTETTVVELRNRLARIKNSIAAPTLAVDVNDDETF